MPPRSISIKTPSVLKNVKKRDGKIKKFDRVRIENALTRAMKASGEGGEGDVGHITNAVLKELEKIARKEKSFIPTVEGIQDIVETQLIYHDFAKTAKSYILYREKHAEIREITGAVPEHVRKLTDESKKYFKNSLSEFVYFRTYARWVEDESRRETWIETVDRYLNFMRENLGSKLKDAEYADLREAILKQEVMPSMRLMQFAGKAARKTHVCAYNCSYIAPTKPQDFGEIMYLSMCGTGVGFSVESQTAQQLPLIKRQNGKKITTHIIDDSKEGWADAFVLGMKKWYQGKDIKFDYSKLRPAGARLNTMGGKSSGPEPLKALIDFAREKMFKKQGKRLSNIDVHDIICKIGEVVVSGGVRRSALISLSDLDDYEMRHAKTGQFYVNDPQRMMANNSASYVKKPTAEEFLEEWIALMNSGSGERGIFNRGSIMDQIPKRRKKILSKNIETAGTNPCGEIILKSKQFCNLSEVVARAGDTERDLLKKTRLATILGTYQSTLTDFKYLSKEWKKNCEEERLLGVSITGQWDCRGVRDDDLLNRMREVAIETNKEYSKRFGINASTSITCVKPSGTVSQLVDASSGMHPRYAQYYVRRIRISATDSLFKMLKDQGVPYYPEVGQTVQNATTFVLEFPVKSPRGAIFQSDVNAMEQLNHWQLLKENFTEHNPSITISVGDEEWITVANWLYDNWEILGGLSFLPSSDHVYKLAPYEEIDREKYEEMAKVFEHIDFAKIMTYEKTDETDVKRELACAGGTCEI